MPTNQFKATQGLLNDTMRKQSGVLEKALLEAVMNGVDAGASNFNVTVESNLVTISDDGGGLSESDIKQYFEQFGKKDDDIEDKEFGKFRMGRGQIFNFGTNIWRSQDNIMVVSLDDDQVTASIPEVQDTDDSSVLDADGDVLTLDTEGLSYAWLKSDENVEGTNIEIALYETLEDVEETVNEFKNLVKYIPWLHDVSITVNDQEVYNEPSVIAETDLAYYCEGKGGFYTRTKLYNKGAYVNSFSIGPESMQIISKIDLDVTLDRTGVLDNDENWRKIKDNYERVVVDRLRQSDELDTDEQKWLINLMTEDMTYVDEFKGEPLVEDVNGDSYALNDLTGSPISFGRKGDKVAAQAMRQSDTVVLDNTYEDPVRDFVQATQELFSGTDVKDYASVVEEDATWEMSELSVDSLSKKRRSNLEKVRSVLDDLGFSGDIKPGNSKHQDVWMDDSDTLYLDRDFLNSKKSVFATEVVFEAIRIAAYDGDTRGGTDESMAWRRNFKKYMQGDKIMADCDYPTAQQRLMNGYYD
jgi:hypothetical protein